MLVIRRCKVLKFIDVGMIVFCVLLALMIALRAKGYLIWIEILIAIVASLLLYSLIKNYSFIIILLIL